MINPPGGLPESKAAAPSGAWPMAAKAVGIAAGTFFLTTIGLIVAVAIVASNNRATGVVDITPPPPPPPMEAAPPAAAPPPAPTCGCWTGVADDGGMSYRGIPYAMPTTGNGRWKPSVYNPASDCSSGTTINATNYGASCPQAPFFVFATEEDEDCLFINVWTPFTSANPPTTPLPVMVYVHGGSLYFASGNAPNYHPTNNMTRDMNVIAVSMNYRLGALGWLATYELSAESPTNTSGNYGMMDVILALQWVQKNIACFGGNPNDVTIYGQSAGGTILLGLLAAPSAAGLFHRAWLLSASANYQQTIVDAQNYNDYFMGAMGCSTLACLRGVSLQSFADNTKWGDYPYWGAYDGADYPTYGHVWGNMAIVDGYVVADSPAHAFQRGVGNDVPLLFGSTAQEIESLSTVSLASWQDLVDKANVTLTNWGPDVFPEAMSLYPSTSYNGVANFAFFSMTSDMRVTCPNSVLSHQVARFKETPVHRYLVNFTYSSVVNLFCCNSTYAFHGLDIVAFFGTFSGAAYGVQPTALDWKITTTLRGILKAFIAGTDLGFQPVPSVGVLTPQATVLPAAGWNTAQCTFWMENGFWDYAWRGD